ncbi:UNVERIFIED_CONTAM: putative multiple sugar transport system permease protein [Acetivibrio alkalicellulosi]
METIKSGKSNPMRKEKVLIIILNNLVGFLKNNIGKYAMLIALGLIIIFFQIRTEGRLLLPMNVTNLILQNGYVLILAIGMVLCILSGGNIDLSVGAVCAFIGGVTGTLIVNMKMDMVSAIIIALLIGAAIGAWQGFWIAYVRIPSFIVTLAGMLIFRGLNTYWLKGLTLSPFPKKFQQISAGFIPDIFSGFELDLNVTALMAGFVIALIYTGLQIKKRLDRKKQNLKCPMIFLFVIKLMLVVAVIMGFSYLLAQHKGIPIVLVIIGTLILIYHFFTLKTVPGRYIYAMGGNEKAAKLSGINTNKVLFLTYVNMGVLASIAGIVFTSRLNAASPQAGVNFELDAIAACFIGGASAYGGVGTVVGAIIGALVMGVLNNGMSISNVDSAIQMAVKGFVLLMAVAFDVLSKKKLSQ